MTKRNDERFEPPDRGSLGLGHHRRSGEDRRKCCIACGRGIDTTGEKLGAILQQHAGERDDNEGAVDVLERIIRERDEARNQLRWEGIGREGSGRT